MNASVLKLSQIVFALSFIYFINQVLLIKMFYVFIKFYFFRFFALSAYKILRGAKKK